MELLRLSKLAKLPLQKRLTKEGSPRGNGAASEWEESLSPRKNEIYNCTNFFSSGVPIDCLISKSNLSIDRYPTVSPLINPAKHTKTKTLELKNYIERKIHRTRIEKFHIKLFHPH